MECKFNFDGLEVKLDFDAEQERKGKYTFTKRYYTFNNLVAKEVDEKQYMVIKDYFNMLDFIQTLKSFSSKKLNPDRLYKFDDFSAKMTSHKQQKYIKIIFNNFEKAYYYDHFEAINLATKIEKVLGFINKIKSSNGLILKKG
jgi:hypothetical protein